MVVMSSWDNFELKEVLLKGNKVYGSVFKMFFFCIYLKDYEKLYIFDIF